MNIEVRIYKHWDIDLLSLMDAGYPVAMMMRDTVINYANGMPCNYFIDEYIPFSLNDKDSVHTRIIIPNSEKKACYLLKNIRNRYRGNFIKLLLRNALVIQNLNCFFTDQNLVNLTSTNSGYRNINMLPNVMLGSQIRNKEIEINILGHKITKKAPDAVVVGNANPYSKMDQSPYREPVIQANNYPVYGYNQQPVAQNPQYMPYQFVPDGNIPNNVPAHTVYQGQIPQGQPYQTPVKDNTVHDVPPVPLPVTNIPEMPTVNDTTNPPINEAINETTDTAENNNDGFSAVDNKDLFALFDNL